MIYISCNREHNAEVEKYLQENEMIFSQRSDGFTNVPPVQKYELAGKLYQVYLANCMILYVKKGDNINELLIQSGACLAQGKELIISGDINEHPVCDLLLTHMNCIRKDSLPDALNYARSLYYRRL